MLHIRRNQVEHSSENSRRYTREYAQRDYTHEATIVARYLSEAGLEY